MNGQENTVDPNDHQDLERNQHLSFMQTCEAYWDLLPKYIKVQVFTYITIATIVYGGLFLTRDDAPMLNQVFDTPARVWSCSNKGNEYTLVEVRSERDRLNVLKEWMIEGEAGSTFSYKFPIEVEKGVLDFLELQITKNYVAGGTVEFEVSPIFTEERGFYKQITLDTGRKITVTDSINAIRSIFESKDFEQAKRLFYVIPHNEYVTRFEILPNNIIVEDEVNGYSCGSPALANVRNDISMEIGKTVQVSE